jgi:hypothetical protein
MLGRNAVGTTGLESSEGATKATKATKAVFRYFTDGLRDPFVAYVAYAAALRFCLPKNVKIPTHDGRPSY